MPFSPERSFYHSPFFRLSRVNATSTGRPFLVLERSAEPYESLVAVVEEISRVVAAFDACPRELGIVVDMRRAPPRNDDAFENAMARLRHAVGRAFPRTVVLLALASGEMQATRLHRSEGYDYTVTRDERDAARIASTPPAPA